MWTAIIRTCRPKQWIKNLILFAGYVFSLGERAFTWSNELQLLGQVAVAFIAFSLLSSAVYYLNDIQDREADRKHPEKRNRPIAAGQLSVPVAYTVLSLLVVLALALSVSLNLAFTMIGLSYFIVFTLYSFGFKRIAVLDVLFIASGFILRAVAGAVAIDVKISGWLIICTLFLALFLGFSKRRTELSSLGSEASKHRSTLKKYNVVQLDLYLSICATLAVVSYTMYTVSDWSRAQVGFDGLLTLPFVIVGIFRYLHLITQRAESADPSALLFRDWPMLTVVVIWGVSWLYLKGINPQILKDIIVL